MKTKVPKVLLPTNIRYLGTSTDEYKIEVEVRVRVRLRVSVCKSESGKELALA